MSNGFGKLGKRSLAGVFATPVILSVVQQNNTVSANESMTWWFAKNILYAAGVGVTFFVTKIVRNSVKKMFGSTNRNKTDVKDSEKVKSKDNDGKATRPVILLVNDNSKGKKYIGFFGNKAGFKKAEKQKGNLNYSKPSNKVTTNFMELFRNAKKKMKEDKKIPLYKGILMKEKFCEIVAEELKGKDPKLTNSEGAYFKGVIENSKNMKKRFNNMKEYYKTLKNKKNNVPLLYSDLFFEISKDGKFKAFYYDANGEKIDLFLHENSPVLRFIKEELNNMKKMNKSENVFGAENKIIISKVKKDGGKEMKKELKKLNDELNGKGATMRKMSEEELNKKLEALEKEINEEEEMRQEKINKETSEEYEVLSKKVYQGDMEKLSKKEEEINNNINYADELVKISENNLSKEEKTLDEELEKFNKEDLEVLDLN